MLPVVGKLYLATAADAEIGHMTPIAGLYFIIIPD